MIYGIGADIVNVARIQQSLDRYGEKFAQRILTPCEQDEFSNHKKPAHFLAKRFAAKEAVAKALGTGFINGLSLNQIGVEHDVHGKPALEYHGYAMTLFDELGITSSYISLADEEDYAIAFVTLLRG